MFKKVDRTWGYWTELYRGKKLCIKVLHFNERSHISMQRHKFRNEFWFMIDGTGLLLPKERDISMFDCFRIKKEQWHQFHAWLRCTILEIQYGSDVREDDIERV